MLGETMVFDGYVDEIGVLKQKIYNAIGIFPHLQILTWEGRPLPDSTVPRPDGDDNNFVAIPVSLLHHPQ